MAELERAIYIVLDDRAIVSGDVSSLVGQRRFGEIIVKRKTLAKHLYAALPLWARDTFFHLRTNADVAELRQKIESSSSDVSVLFISAKAAFNPPERLTQLLERLPYAEENISDRLYKPLLVFIRNAHSLVEHWNDLEKSPLNSWERSWQDCQNLTSFALDLSSIRDFLSYTGGSTATRHFNEVSIDTYYYTKRSSDKQKMLAEYSFYNLVPESMRPWLIQPFDYRDEGERASYKMLRYYFADAALQWVHGAFSVETFIPFIDRLLFFFDDRPQKACSKAESKKVARSIFVTKLETRTAQFLSMPEGLKINQLATSSSKSLDLAVQLQRYKSLYERYEKNFAFDYMVVAHGDPCFSNLLYDQQRYLLQLIDPRGAVTESELWTHPLYDLCKISHSALGDYDFINNGLFNIGFTETNELMLIINHTNHAALKPIFIERARARHDITSVRLGEASLFLSMLPLHIDHPNKILAFLLKAKQILDEVENGC